MSEHNRYTAQEMRNMADCISNIKQSEMPSWKEGEIITGGDLCRSAEMLRQAAEMIKRCEMVKLELPFDSVINTANYILRGDAGKEEQMAERNALAELARRIDGLYSEVYCYIGHTEAEDYLKTLRIIAELAKVEDVTDVQVPNGWQCYDAVKKCRAIAEEGAKE